jgi:hypothetical protein
MSGAIPLLLLYACFAWTVSLYFFYNRYVEMLNLKVKKIKCTLVQALRLCTGRRAHRGNRGIALLFHDYGTRRG